MSLPLEYEDPATTPVVPRRRVWATRRDAAAFFGALIALIALWQILPEAGILDARIFPPPSALISTAGGMFGNGLWSAIGDTMVRFAGGVVFGAIPGLALGLLMGMSKIAKSVFAPLIAMLFPIPIVAVFPLALLVFGPDAFTVYLIIAMGPFFITTIYARTAFASIPPVFFDVGRSYGARNTTLVRRIALPAMLPVLAAGLRLAVGVSLLVSVTVEYLFVSNGIGYVLWQAWQQALMQNAMVCVAVIAFIAYVIYEGLGLAERRLTHWSM